MYDELVKRLKNCATQAAPCLTCDMTDDCSCIETLMKQAADAIEELRQQVEHSVPAPPHGRWNNIIQGIIPSGQCSNCGAWDKVTRFCPNCGSRMEDE